MNNYTTAPTVFLESSETPDNPDISTFSMLLKTVLVLLDTEEEDSEQVEANFSLAVLPYILLAGIAIVCNFIVLLACFKFGTGRCTACIRFCFPVTSQLFQILSLHEATVVQTAQAPCRNGNDIVLFPDLSAPEIESEPNRITFVNAERLNRSARSLPENVRRDGMTGDSSVVITILAEEPQR